MKPRVITRFEPWMALSFTEGSIGGDIESNVNLAQLQAFYGKEPVAAVGKDLLAEPSGSNGIAIAPKNTAGGNALLLINPHTSFFFRSELQMKSGEGLNAYGAATWGQIFIYQGFNDRLGWMHTSSKGDAVDEWREKIVQKDGRYFYKYGNEQRPMTTATITVPYKTASGMAERKFTVYSTHHGPVVRKDEATGDWISIGLMNTPVNALMQSYLTAAAEISRLAVGDARATAKEVTFNVPRWVSQREQVEGAPFGTRPATAAGVEPPVTKPKYRGPAELVI